MGKSGIIPFQLLNTGQVLTRLIPKPFEFASSIMMWVANYDVKRKRQIT
jgi:hypothetical protein